MAACVRLKQTGGPSPRVRGSPPNGETVFHQRRSIPACAGKPAAEADPRESCGVHPRVCGEAASINRRRKTVMGPSPRVRGSRAFVPRARDHNGSIPACAGKPARGVCSKSNAWVHPRVCGEARRRPMRLRSSAGPSPRVRGSPIDLPDLVRRPGSIPACAGKPRTTTTACTARRVHPRVCGEAEVDPSVAEAAAGPSPRVRGSLSRPRSTSVL